MSRKAKGDDRQEPQFGYQYRRQEPYLEEPRAAPRQPAARRRRERSIIPLFLAGATLIVFAGFIWVSYVKGPKIVSGQLPVITADPSPVKIKPDKAGGTDIPFQDTTVYDDLNQTKQKHKATEVEHLLQPPEQPLPMPAPPAPVAPATEVQPAPDQKSVQENTLPAPPPASVPAPAPKAAESEPADHSDDEAALAPAEPAKLPPPPAVKIEKPVSKTVPATGGHSTIQLGSFHDEAAADGEWKRLKGRYSDQLSALSPTVQRVDLGDKGIWYRLRAGPLGPDQAKTTCATLKDSNVPCIVSTH